MKNLISISFLFSLALPLFAQERPPVDPNERLDALAGQYSISARIWPAPGSEPITGSGTAIWERSHDGAHMHEHFTLEVNGKELEGDAWIAWRPRAKRFELTQIDGFSSTTFWLVGGWDDERARISLHDLEATRHPVGPEMRWEFRYEADGFVKEILRADGQGGWVLMSDYRYTEAGVRGPEATEIPGVVEVPMEAGFQWAVVEVRINGEGPFRMVLDTGASTTVLHADLVEELGLESLGTSRIGDPSDPLANEVDDLLLGDVMLGDARFDGVRAVGWRTEPLVPMGGIRGVLGLPTFANCLLTLDYPNRMVVLQAGTLPEPDGRTVLPMTVRGIPSFPIIVAGHEFEAHLDAGNASSLVLPAVWEAAMPLVEGSRSSGQGMRASGPVEFTAATLDGSVSLGEHTFNRPAIRFDAGLNEANVGYGLMQGFVVTLDQRSGRVRLAAPSGEEQAGAPQVPMRKVVEAPTEGRRRLGVAMRGGSDGLTVVNEVFPDSAAEKAGLEIGDSLLKVDGDPMTHERLIEALAGTEPIVLEVERGGATIEVLLYE